MTFYWKNKIMTSRGNILRKHCIKQNNPDSKQKKKTTK